MIIVLHRNRKCGPAKNTRLGIFHSYLSNSRNLCSGRRSDNDPIPMHWSCDECPWPLFFVLSNPPPWLVFSASRSMDNGISIIYESILVVFRCSILIHSGAASPFHLTHFRPFQFLSVPRERHSSKSTELSCLSNLSNLLSAIPIRILFLDKGIYGIYFCDPPIVSLA